MTGLAFPFAPDRRFVAANVAPCASPTWRLRRERVASGVQTAVEAVATALSPRGPRSELWHVGDWAPAMEPAADTALRDAGVRCRRLEARWGRGALLPAVDIPAAETVDVVHLHSVFVPTNTAIARSWCGPPCCHHMGVYDPVSLQSQLRPQAGSTLRSSSGRWSAGADHRCSHPDRGRAGWRAYAGSVPIVVIPNGVTARAASREGGWFRSEIGVSPDARLALFAGRLDVYTRASGARFVKANRRGPRLADRARRARPSATAAVSWRRAADADD